MAGIAPEHQGVESGAAGAEKPHSLTTYHQGIKAAKAKGITTVALLGRDGGKLKAMADLAIVIPAQTSDRIQEMHIKLIHTVIETVERVIFPENY